jgi:hypothetical protein
MQNLFAKILASVAFTLHTCIAFAQFGEWTWIKGSSGNNGNAVYGTMGEPDPANTPGAFYEPMQWTDKDGNFWLFGGLNYSFSEYNTLWKFDPVTEEWTWVRGSSSCCANGVYGVQGIPSPDNDPGARAWGGWTWVDTAGYLWLYGGIGEDELGGYQVLSDLWRYDIATNEWTWMDGPNTGTVAVYYGTKGTPSSNTSPGARAESNAAWVDEYNRYWLFGGALYYPMQGGWSIAGFGNDMWMWDPGIQQWTWMQGTQQLSMGGVYGTQGVSDSANYPPGRGSYSRWEDKEGNFYFFGGYNLGACWNDLWKYDWQTNVFTWVSGPSSTNGLGTYGTICIPDGSNIPPARYENRTYWQDTCDNFWLFGGISSASGNTFNDLWHYNLEDNTWTWMKGSNTGNSTGSYGTQGVSDPTNVPPGRSGGVGWADASGSLWMFGGVTSFIGTAYKNDLWRFVPDPTCPAITVCASAPPAIIASDTTVCEKFCIDFIDQSGNNAVEWLWIFEGASPSTSNEQNPGDICYDDPGIFDVTLITIDAMGTADTLVKSDFITVYQNPFAPTIIQNGNVLTSTSAITYQWYLNGTLIPGATNQSLEITASGLYTVVITNESGCEAQSSYQAYMVGIENTMEEFSAELLSNPVYDELILLTKGSGLMQIEFMNLLGQVLMQRSMQVNRETQIAFPEVIEFAAGTYLLKINSGDSIAVMKWIKE